VIACLIMSMKRPRKLGDSVFDTIKEWVSSLPIEEVVEKGRASIKDLHVKLHGASKGVDQSPMERLHNDIREDKIKFAPWTTLIVVGCFVGIGAYSSNPQQLRSLIPVSSRVTSTPSSTTQLEPTPIATPTTISPTPLETTPAPTPTTISPSPTAAHSPEPVNTPSAYLPETTRSSGKSLNKTSNPALDVSSPEKFLKVKAENLQTYKYTTGLFEIDIPEGWAPIDNSKPGEAIVLWFDPTKNALITVDIFNAPPGMDDEKMTELLKTFLTKTFGNRSGFFMEEPIAQSDRSVQVVWGYTETIEGATGRVQGNSFIERVGNKASLLTTGVLDHQFDDLKYSMSQIINSYKINSSTELP
jgi:hypothetical protein